nr:hypothetical protein [uncultured bacterium]
MSKAAADFNSFKATASASSGSNSHVEVMTRQPRGRLCVGIIIGAAIATKP